MIISILHPINLEWTAGVIFFFTLYSFFGWLLENSYSFFTKAGFFKPNFLMGPFKPMYGFAPILLLIFINNHTSWPIIVLLCFFIPTIVEYVSGTILQQIFHRQYWDYSHFPLQLHGHICLPFSLCWLLLSILCLKGIHPFIVALYERAESYWIFLSPAVLFYFLIELLMAIKKHSVKVVSDKETASNTIQ